MNAANEESRRAAAQATMVVHISNGKTEIQAMQLLFQEADVFQDCGEKWSNVAAVFGGLNRTR